MKPIRPQTSFRFTAYHLLADYRSHLSWPRFFEHGCGLAAVAVLGMLSYFLVTHFIFQYVRVNGSSMSPTLFDNESYFLNRGVYWRHEPRRADIVAARDPEDGCLVVKRIIAMPGELAQFYPRDMLSTMTATSVDASNHQKLSILGQRVLGGGHITRDEASWLFNLESSADILDLLSWANRIREHFKGNKIHLVLHCERQGRRVFRELQLLRAIVALPDRLAEIWFCRTRTRPRSRRRGE
jgi:hypothetical protein